MKKNNLFLSLCLSYKWRGVTSHSEIMVGEERRVSPHSEIIVGDEPPYIF